MSPRRSASASAAVRSWTLNLARMLLIWARAVSSLMPSSAATSLFRIPGRQKFQHLQLAQRQKPAVCARASSFAVTSGGIERWPACTSRITRQQILGHGVLQQVSDRPGCSA